jgi:hypothetical protein
MARRRYVKSADAARMVGQYLWENRGTVVGRTDIAAATGLTSMQISGAEHDLKKLVSDNPDRFQGYVLYVALGNSGDHGFLQESLLTLADQVSRARYMQHRAETEITYTSQAADRIMDSDASRRLTRALVAYRGAAAILEDALRVVEEALVEAETGAA